MQIYQIYFYKRNVMENMAIFDMHCRYKNILKLVTNMKLEKCIKQKCEEYCM